MTRASEWWAGLGQRRLAATASVICILIVVVTLTTALVVPQAMPVRLPSAFGNDRWPEAARQTQDLLSQTPGFQERMRGYRALADEIDADLGILERARQASGVFDELHKLNIPIVGNAWQLLVNTLNTVLPGRGDALDSLDSSLRQIVAFRGKLAILRDADAVAVAAQDFRDNPSQKTLKALRDTSVFYGGVLDSVDKDIQAPKAAIAGAIDRIDGIQQGLQKSQDTLSRLPLLPSLVGRLNQTLSDIFDPLRTLQNDLDRLDAQIQLDLRTISAIQTIVAAAEGK